MDGRVSPLGRNDHDHEPPANDEETQHRSNGKNTKKGARNGSAGSHRSRHGSGSRHSLTRKGSAKSLQTETRMSVDGETNDSTTEDGDNSVVHVGSYRPDDADKGEARSQDVERGPDDDGEDDKDGKRIAKIGRRLKDESEKYVTEKQMLKNKMERAREKFQDEISHFDTELDGTRQEYLRRMSDLKLDEQCSALSHQMGELTEIRGELDSRFQQSVHYEKEIEEIERYLDRRQQLCNSKEEGLRLLDDQLDVLHQELELDKERLERAGFDTANARPRNRAFSYRSPQKGAESDGDDYILKANLRKCQSDLKKAEYALHERDAEMAVSREEISSLQSERKRYREKIKQLESQLSIALSQLKNQANPSTSASTLTLNRKISTRSHVSLDRFNSAADLSINQRAQLNRTLSAKVGSGGMPLAGKRYLSKSSDMLNSSFLGVTDGENSRGSSDETGSDTNPHKALSRQRSATVGSYSQKNVSSACNVM